MPQYEKYTYPCFQQINLPIVCCGGSGGGYGLCTPHYKKVIPASTKSNAVPLANGYAVSPMDIATFYKLPSYTVSSVWPTNNPTIVIIDAYDPTTIATDINLFSAYHGLSQMNVLGGTNPALPTFTIYYQTGTGKNSFQTGAPAYGSNSGWDIEIAIDVQSAHGVSPYSNIILILSATASNADINYAISYGNSLKPTNNIVAMTMSFGSTETSGSNTNNAFINSSGILYCASSGDGGGTTKGQSVPAACTNVVACGGTSVNALNYATSSSLTETAWADSTGGYSKYATTPTWQLSVNKTGKRALPDISAVADPSTGLYLFYKGTLDSANLYGGTSLATPVIAGIITLLVQNYTAAYTKQVYVNYTNLMTLIYTTNPSSYTTDIITKDSTSSPSWPTSPVYSPAAGYDCVTGMGSLIYAKLVANVATFITHSS